MAALKIKDVIKKSQRVAWEMLNNEGVLLNLDNGNYFSLNEVGVDIWERLEGDKSIGEIASVIAKEYNVPYRKALPDVLSFVDMLLKRGVAEIRITDKNAN